jgi:hypothetical protein
VSDRRAEQTAIFDQGPRGTCAACAVTSAHEWLRAKESLSVEDAFHQGKRLDRWLNEEYTSVHHVLSGIEGAGHALAAAWPYGDPAYPAPAPVASLNHANRRALLSVWHAQRFATLRDMISVVERHCVILTLGFVPSAWDNDDGVIQVEDEFAPQDAHAVLAVGSDVRNGQSVIVIKNSWGDAWGDSGYGYVTAAYADRYLLAAHVIERAA